ncbi:hypothetical protein J2X31_002703 [Flavobacterium arsenatis]|uniref:Lipoprotein n=1 Tax=Flavobacterium arsenatis TaxID=1484332 RepID=A0ABU1TS22_9FLAO|nr:hypothetical protein [Flavobacterium arsenatis]MDR6968677.1 hypothetical protein [Flavobacterium arsenatis]
MKKIALLLLAVITISSCSLEENNEPQFYYEVLPVESFVVPQSVRVGENYEILMTYKRPSNCHVYEGCYYKTEGYTTIVGIQTYVLDNPDCQELSLENQQPLETSFIFTVEGIQNSIQPYIFKFYKGKDSNGNDIFEEVSIPVTYN